MFEYAQHKNNGCTYAVRLAPTVIFVDSNGQISGKPLVGYNAPDFYGAYLDRGPEQLARHRSGDDDAVAVDAR